MTYPTNSIADNNDTVFDAIVVVLKDYLKDRENKNRFIEEVEKFKITGNRYKLFVENLTDSIRTDFYQALATLDNEKDNWFQEETLDFIKMGLAAATNKEDSVYAYEAITLSCFKKILNKQDVAEVSSIKKYLDNVIFEINGMKSDSEKINISRMDILHNFAIIERLMGNYREAEDLLKPLTVMSNIFGPRARRIERTTNSMNELGRVYLSQGIVNNNDKLIEKAIGVFDEAINILETENCAPYHLEELYQRKQKAFFLLERSSNATALVDKLNTFSTERCHKSTLKQRSIHSVFYQSILYDFPNIELVEDISLSIHQKEILVSQKETLLVQNETLVKQSNYKTYLITAIFTIAGLLAFMAYNWWDKSTRLQRSIAKLKILQFNSSAVLDTMKSFDTKAGKLEFLNNYLVEIYNQFKDQMKEDSGFAAVFFNRKKNEIASKIIGAGKNGSLQKREAENYKMDNKSIYYPFYTGKKDLYTEQNFQSNYTQHNRNTTNEYLTQKDITSQSIICAPLIFNQSEKPLGIISLQNDNKAFFNKDHIDLMKAIANMLTPVAAYFEIEEQRNLVEQQRNTIKEQRDLIIGIVDHRFRNYYKINNSAIQRVQANIENWDKEKLKNKLIAFGGDYQIHEKLFNSFISWMRIIGITENNKLSENGDYTDFNLQQVIESVFEQLYFPIRENSIKYSIVCESQIYIQKMPLIYIQEIIANLVINTIQHFKEIEKEDHKPEIKIEVSLNNQNLLIGIADNGEGMPQSNAKNMFKDVLTINYNKTQKRGFGNRVIKYILEKVNGTVAIIHSNKIDGTKIEISIPKQYVKKYKNEATN